MACRLDLAEIRVLSVRLRLENIDIDNVSVHQLIQGNWLMSCSCKVLDVKVGHVHNGLTLISSLVWWRTRCPRKWRKSRKGNPICCSLLSYKKQIFEMLLLLSCVFKSVRLFDVIYSEIKALCASELNSSEDFSAEHSNYFGLKVHANIFASPSSTSELQHRLGILNIMQHILLDVQVLAWDPTLWFAVCIELQRNNCVE